MKVRCIVAALLLFICEVSVAEEGLASCYHEDKIVSERDMRGRQLPFRPEALTAAHRTLPIGTCLNVHSWGKKVNVRINDRGPCADGGPCHTAGGPFAHRVRERLLDLSPAAAAALGGDQCQLFLRRVYFHVAPCEGEHADKTQSAMELAPSPAPNHRNDGKRRR